jgi:hypothetical protein
MPIIIFNYKHFVCPVNKNLFGFSPKFNQIATHSLELTEVIFTGCSLSQLELTNNSVIRLDLLTDISDVLKHRMVFPTFYSDIQL